jgi:transposase
MAEGLGRGGKTAAAKASGLSGNTVIKGKPRSKRASSRRSGCGRRRQPAIDKQPGLTAALDELVHPDTRGTPMWALHWTLKSTYQLARELQAQGFKVSAELVRRLLHQMGYSPAGAVQAGRGSVAPRP